MTLSRQSVSRHIAVMLSASMVLAVTVGMTGGVVLAETVERCDRDNIMLPALGSEVQGTTFTGTYQGDNLGGLGIVDGLTTYWNVDRVYAGGPLPSDLAFQTPACAWTNLTPGVRYLFSTSAIDIAIDDDTGLDDHTGMPQVEDSVAWEIAPDDSVTLAPFDAYVASDYAADLRSIPTLAAALDAAAPGSGEGEPPGPPTIQGVAGCTGEFEPPATAQVQGTAFVGRYIGEDHLPGSPTHRQRDVRVHWVVERVYAGGPLPEVLTIRTGACDPLTLTPGRRYLFSTATIAHPGPWDALAWRLQKGDQVKLAFFDGVRAWVPEVRAIDTFDEALEAVAPSSGTGEPPLRAGDRTPG